MPKTVKRIYKYENIKDKIASGIEKLAAPIVQTLTPKGSNVIISELKGGTHTNDGFTIAKEIELEDPVENTFARIVKESATKTNSVAGDGTTTSILLSATLIREGMRLLDKGWNPMDLKTRLNAAGIILTNTIKKIKKEITDKESLRFVAQVSSNNDKEISDNVFDATSFAGLEGLVILDLNNKDATELIKENGFTIDAGMFSSYFANYNGRAQYKDVRILVTDKRIYHADEAIRMLEPIVQAGIKDAVIVAKDFIGQSLNVFTTNHQKGVVNLLLVKDPSTEKDSSMLEDLAEYLGVVLVSDKAGKMTHKITLEDFGTAQSVISFKDRTVISCPPSISAAHRAGVIRAAIEETKDDVEIKKLKKRLSAMTTGTVKILVGGRTEMEVREKVFRYEDAVNATRAAMREGYVVGGGISLYQAFHECREEMMGLGEDVYGAMQTLCEAPMTQIAENCRLDLEELRGHFNKGKGYNAVTDKYEDLHKAGIIEPYLVLDMSVQNAVATAGVILGSQYYVIEEEVHECHHDQGEPSGRPH